MNLKEFHECGEFICIFFFYFKESHCLIIQKRVFLEIDKLSLEE